jgi:putative transcriptional regulator
LKNQLARLRKEKGLTQQELAEILKISRQSVIAIETGKFNPSVILAIKISRFFELPVDEIFIYQEDENEICREAEAAEEFDDNVYSPRPLRHRFGDCEDLSGG